MYNKKITTYPTWSDVFAEECWDMETQSFDWEAYQYFCDITEYWDLDNE